jgi:hypothetical protein
MTKVTFEIDLSVVGRWIVRSTEFNEDDSFPAVCIGFLEKEFSDTPFFYSIDESVRMLSEAETLAIGEKLQELNKDYNENLRTLKLKVAESKIGGFLLMNSLKIKAH